MQDEKDKYSISLIGLKESHELNHSKLLEREKKH